MHGAEHLLAIMLLTVAGQGRAESTSWQFTPHGWSLADWVLVKSPSSTHCGRWVQQADHVQNEVPAAATPAEWQGARAAECYTSMVYGRKLRGDAKVSTTLWFTPHMAPLIVLAPELGQDAQGRPEYREHWEVCVYDQGINFWHHTWTDGQPAHHLACYARFALRPETAYRLEVELHGKQLLARIDGHEVGYREEALPAVYHVGLTGCEGLNRFYDFAINGTWAEASPPPAQTAPR